MDTKRCHICFSEKDRLKRTGRSSNIYSFYIGCNYHGSILSLGSDKPWLGLDVAFQDIVSLVIAGLYTSYLIGNVLVLWHDIRGTISLHDDKITGPTNTAQAGNLTWGPWKVPEPFGTIVSAIGILSQIVVLFFSYWPTTTNPGAAGMNCSVLVVGAATI